MFFLLWSYGFGEVKILAADIEALATLDTLVAEGWVVELALPSVGTRSSVQP